MKTLLKDVRFAARTLWKRPGFTVVAVLTLALGVGANTAIFSVVNGVLFKPLPLKEAERLVLVYETTPTQPRSYVSVPNLEDYRAGTRSFESFATYVPQSVNLTGGGEPERVVGAFVPSGFFKTVGVEPAVGRAFLPEDDVQGAGLVAVLGHETWQKRFGADPSAVGKSLVLNGEPYQIVGVMPEGFGYPISAPDVLLPAQKWPNYEVARSAHNCWVVGRLRPGVTREAAEEELRAVARRLEEAYPEDNRGRGVQLVGLHESVVEDIRPALLILLVAVGFILLIACANIANLLLARGAARQKEMALRSALGASRGRLLRQLLTESVLLALAGGFVGLLLAQWGVDALLALNPAELPAPEGVRLDASVLTFSLGLSAVAGFVFGVVPALQLSKADLGAALKEGGRGAGEGSQRTRLRGVFVVSQVALSLVLLVGAGLLLNSFYRLLNVSPGFDPRNLLTMEYRLPRNRYPEREQQWRFHREVAERVARVPGVESAAIIRGLPFSGNGGSVTYVIPDRPAPPRGQEPKALENAIDPNYLRTVGLPLLRGRNFDERDTLETAPVVLVNRLMAEQLWPGEDPLGKQLQFPEAKVTASVVGVVGDAKQYDIGEPQRPQVYTPYAQNPHIFGTLVVRAQGVEPLSLTRSVKEAVWSVDPEQPVWKVRTVEHLLSVNVADRRFVLWLMTCFAGLAVLLTALGIYGVVSYTVAQRTHEIGIRMALGAERRDVLRMVLGRGMKLALAGVGAGLAVAFGVTRLMTGLLYGVSAADPLTYAAVALLLAFVALVACYIPARRATKVDPLVALRYE
jgi:putative ABC transport system permease protein